MKSVDKDDLKKVSKTSYIFSHSYPVLFLRKSKIIITEMKPFGPETPNKRQQSSKQKSFIDKDLRRKQSNLVYTGRL